MQFQKQINISSNNAQYQYRTKEYFHPNSRIIYQGPKIYKEEIYYQYEPNSYKITSAIDSDKQLENNNEENPTSKIYAIRREINSANKNIASSQLLKDRSFNSSLKNIRKNLKEEIEPSPKTINVGDTKESIEYNYRTIHTRRSPNIGRKIISRKDDFIEYRNGSFDGNRNYYNTNRRISNYYYEPPQGYIIRNHRVDNSPINYIERSGNRVIERMSSEYNNNRNSPYDEQMSPYNNYDELNISNDYGGSSYDYNNNNLRQNYTETISNDYDYNRQNRFDNSNNQFTYQGNNIQRMRNMNMNEYNNYNNNITTNEYQSSTSKIRNLKPKRSVMNSTMMSFAPKHPQRYSSINNNNELHIKDDIQEKYQNQTYNNMTYNDVKNIVNKFTRVYDPKKNENGLLIEDSKVIVPGAEDEVFNNRYRVLNKMRRLSNILLAKQNSNNILKRRSSSKKDDDEIFYTINTNFNNRTNNNFYREENNEFFDENENNNSDNEYNIRSFNQYQLNKKAKTPIKYISRKSTNQNNRFKYVSLAMLASKGINTENRIILRKMRLEKGGVVDLAQMEKKRGKYKIRKVSRSPGYKRTYYRKTFRYREKAAKKIQEWWRKMKSFMSKKIAKIIKIQSIYRGRFVRKYLYDLLYLNYLYLSFCQKIEHVLKKKIKPYIFYILKNYGKSKTISFEEIKDFDILRNIIASKEKKWKILNLRKGMNKLRQYLRYQQKVTLALYKLLKLKAEKNNNKNSILKNALRKWDYITKIELMQVNNNNDNVTQVIQNQNDKIKGLFNIIKGVNIYAKKSALEPTIPKIVNYLKEQKLKNLLRKLINNKSISDKEKLKDYFYKYIRITLKYLTEKETEQIIKEEVKPKNYKELIKQEEVRINIDYEPIKKEEEVKKEENPKIIEEEPKKEVKILKGKTNKIIKPKYIITKEEYINIPKVHLEIKEEPKEKIKPVFKIDNSINAMEIKGKPKEKEVIKEIIEIVKYTEKNEIKEKKLEINNYENIELKGKEKRKDEIMKMKGRLFLYLINSARNKQNKNILRKYFFKYFKKILQIQRDEDRKIFKEKQDEKENEIKTENLKAYK